MAFKEFKHFGHDEKMKMENFKRWMLRKFDENGDGKLSKAEICEAMRAHGGWFCRIKGRRVLKKFDRNGDGFIDETEMSALVDFARKYLNITVVG